MNLEERQRIEVEFWKNSPTERPESESIENIINKASDAEVFIDCLKRYEDYFRRASTILELGAGQGWASCIVKRLFPEAFVIATDISPWAVASAHKWEHIYQVSLDEATECKSYDIPKNGSSIDCIFCFAAAHHFVAHRRTLGEVHRVLKPGGSCFYFYEPSCRPYVYKLAKRRKNKNRPEVPEDVLVFKKIQNIAEECGLRFSMSFYPSLIKRGPAETLYYAALSRIPMLQQFLPCTANYHFRKPAATS